MSKKKYTEITVKLPQGTYWRLLNSCLYARFADGRLSGYSCIVEAAVGILIDELTTEIIKKSSKTFDASLSRALLKLCEDTDVVDDVLRDLDTSECKLEKLPEYEKAYKEFDALLLKEDQKLIANKTINIPVKAADHPKALALLKEHGLL